MMSNLKESFRYPSAPRLQRQGATARLLVPNLSDETLVLGQLRSGGTDSPPRTPRRMEFEGCDGSVSVPSMTSSSLLGPPQEPPEPGFEKMLCEP